jgi:hypothetical protein
MLGESAGVLLWTLYLAGFSNQSEVLSLLSANDGLPANGQIPARFAFFICSLEGLTGRTRKTHGIRHSDRDAEWVEFSPPIENIEVTRAEFSIEHGAFASIRPRILVVCRVEISYSGSLRVMHQPENKGP